MRHLMTVVLVCSSGCGLFCPPPYKCASQGAIVVRVSDAETQARLPAATVLASQEGASAVEVPACPFDIEAEADGGSNCRAIRSLGKYHLTVQAAGYAQTELDVEATQDACGSVPTQKRQVDLQKLGSATQALVESSEGGCN